MQYNVTAHNLVPDHSAVQTAAIQKLVDLCHADGGGTLYFPRGTYVTGTVHLKSNVTLHLENGAQIKGSPHIGDYPSFGLVCEKRDTALFLAKDQQNIHIEGHGEIHGNCSAFFDMTRPITEFDYDPLMTRQKAEYTVKRGIEDGPAQMHLKNGKEQRPGNMILFINCEKISVTNITIRESPNWCLHMAGCTYGSIRGVSFQNSLLVPNADCVDLANSSHINISDCMMHAGDDGIAISPCADGYAMSTCEYINVTNCTIVSRSSAIRVGYGITPVRNCIFSNINIHDSNRGIGVFIRNGQEISNVIFSNIHIETRLFTGWWGCGEPIHISAVPGYTEDASLGTIRNVIFQNITARGPNGILIYGADHEDGEKHIKDICFDNVKIEIVDDPLNQRFGGNIDLRPADEITYKIFERDLPGILVKNVDGLRFQQVEVRWNKNLPQFFTRGVELVTSENCDTEDFVETDLR